MDHLTEQDAGLLEQAASMLEGLANDERNRGNCSSSEGAACSAHAIRRLAPAMLRAGRGCLAQIEEPAGAAPAAVAGPAPKGWRLVPATPTRDWIAAVADGGYEDCDCASLIADILSRAPAAPALEAPAAAGLTDGQLDDESYRVNDEPGYSDAFRAGARFAERVHGLTAAAARAVTGKADWWRGRADEIEAQVARSGSSEAMRCYTDMRTLLQAAAAPQAPAAPVHSKTYSDGTVATGSGELPAQSPQQQVLCTLLDTVEAMLGGANGPTIQIRAALLAAPAAPALSAAPIPVMPRAITAGLGLDDSGEEPAYCVMVAFRQEDDARYALSILSAGLGATAAPAAGNWIAAEEVDRLVRDLDVALHGEADAAPQASLCDIVGLTKAAASKLGRPVLAAPAAPCGLCGADEAFTGTCGGGRQNPRALCFEGAAPAAPAVDATSDTALLDAMQRHRIALVPEFEGPWDAEIFNDEAEAPLIASGNTPREALHAALAAQAKEGGEPA